MSEIECVCVCVGGCVCVHAQSCPTLSVPMDCSLPGSSIHGIFQATVLEWGAIAFSKTLCTHTQNIFYLLKQKKRI